MTEDPRSHLPVAPAAFEVLVSLSAGPQHGYGLIQEIRERSGGVIDLATSSLYSIVRRLEDAGLVSEAEEGSPSSGPPRRNYRITRLGLKVAQLEAERLQRVARTARRLLLDPESRAP